MKKRISDFFVSVSLLSSLLLTSGCYYHQSGDFEKTGQNGYQWRSLYREDIQTVSIPIFTNRTYMRGVEFQLTQAVVKQLEASAPYKVVSSSKADTILEGEIVSIRTQTISQGSSNAIPQEQLASFKINFVWKDLRSGRILVNRRDFEQAATYYPTLGEGRFTGQQEAIERAALAIVQELQADW